MSLCVCVSVEHLLLKKACFLLWKGEEQREDGRGARRRADDKSRTAQRACRNQMQTNQPHRFLSRVHFVFIFKGLYSYCHLLCQAYMLKRWGTWILDCIYHDGKLSPHSERCFCFLAFWLVKQKRSSCHPKVHFDVYSSRSHSKHTFMKSLRVWTQQGFMFAILHRFHRFGSIYTTRHIHSLLWTPSCFNPLSHL